MLIYPMAINSSLQQNQGRRERDVVWVFGVLYTEQSPCRDYLRVVHSWDGATLNQALQRVLLPGSEVHSDYWGAYRKFAHHMPNVTVHRTVVHHANFFFVSWQESTGKSLNQRGVHWNTTSNEKKAYELWTRKTSLKKKCGDNRGVWILLYRM